MSKPKIVVLSGAGISAESGLKTFRAQDGLWENHSIEDVATPQGWQRNPQLVLDFYNQRRKQLKNAQPNAGHKALLALEEAGDLHIITQNVDDLHERAGSKNVLHLHGELTKVRSDGNENDVKHWTEDVNLGDACELGHQLRPHIVWFGEQVPMLSEAERVISNAKYVIIVGTSMQVYPAAGLLSLAPSNTYVYYVDPSPAQSVEFHGRQDRLTVLAESATTGLPVVVDEIISNIHSQ